MSLRIVVAAALLAILPLTAGLVVLATHEPGWCAQTQETIPVGTGKLLGDVEALAGVTYLDLPYPPCSSGRFWIDHVSGPVETEQHCAEGFLRVYGGAGNVSVQFVVNWLPSGQGCS